MPRPNITVIEEGTKSKTRIGEESGTFKCLSLTTVALRAAKCVFWQLGKCLAAKPHCSIRHLILTVMQWKCRSAQCTNLPNSLSFPLYPAASSAALLPDLHSSQTPLPFPWCSETPLYSLEAARSGGTSPTSAEGEGRGARGAGSGTRTCRPFCVHSGSH